MVVGVVNSVSEIVDQVGALIDDTDWDKVGVCRDGSGCDKLGVCVAFTYMVVVRS